MYSFYLHFRYVIIFSFTHWHPRLLYLPSITTATNFSNAAIYLTLSLLPQRLSNEALNLQGSHGVLTTSDKKFEL